MGGTMDVRRIVVAALVAIAAIGAGATSPADAGAAPMAGFSPTWATTVAYTEPGAGRSMTMAVARIPFPKRTAHLTEPGASS